MPRHSRVRDPLEPNPHVDNDGLTLSQTTDRSTWSLPSDEGAVGVEHEHELAVPVLFDYSAGILVGHDHEADAQASDPVHHLIRARVDAPAQFQLPHEATHRRYEPPRPVAVNQLAAGYTLIAPAVSGLHYVKVIAAYLTLDAAGSLKFVQGGDGTAAPVAGGDLTGAIALGGAAASPLQLAPAELANPWLFTAPDQPLGIFTATGKAQGWVLVAYSPYDA